MYKCIELDKEFSTKEELFKALKENKEAIIASKKMRTKEADSTFMVYPKDNIDNNVNKEESGDSSNPTKLKAKLVINTTNLLDSHSDVHIKGIWNKSVKEQKSLYLLQEHRMKFDHIISDNVTAKVELMKWSDLGFKLDGDTEALIFDAEIEKERNEYMFKQYSKGYVKEHSVGMRYVKLQLALNSESKYDVEEKEIWDKYYDEIANKDVADSQGYFWAVTEAKIIEGSAVVKGSNYATPTISVEPSNDTQKQDEAVKDDTSHNTYFLI